MAGNQFRFALDKVGSLAGHGWKAGSGRTDGNLGLRRRRAVTSPLPALLGRHLGNELKARNSDRNGIADAYD